MYLYMRFLHHTNCGVHAIIILFQQFTKQNIYDHSPYLTVDVKYCIMTTAAFGWFNILLGISNARFVATQTMDKHEQKGK